MIVTPSPVGIARLCSGHFFGPPSTCTATPPPRLLQGPVPIQRVFQDNMVYCGGFTAQQVCVYVCVFVCVRVCVCCGDAGRSSSWWVAAHC